MNQRFTNIFLDKKYLNKLYNQVFDSNIQAYLTNIDNLNIFIYISSLRQQATINVVLLKLF
jgi:hypothetical protein